MDGDGEWPTSEEVARHLRIPSRRIVADADWPSRRGTRFVRSNARYPPLLGQQRGSVATVRITTISRSVGVG
jgi:hypothetical protein